ncbi:MAG: 4Fe-4S binding protein [Methanobacterium sp.]|uniref:helix-turn-helix domain-containing protein n=1 Tax=Methanobacterium sp. TaxID=2164 RepID=UPI003D6508C4|nr:4Fe-4S binding protein [Methanobacterium sp.]
MPKHILSGLNYLAAINLRKDGYLQKEIAETLGMDRSTVSHYINGRNISWDSIEIAETISKLCPEDFLKMTNALTKDTEKTRTIIITLMGHKFDPKVKDSCIGCGLCVDTCLMKAVDLTDLKAQIDPNWCCGCRICESRCPTNSIEILEVQETEGF